MPSSSKGELERTLGFREALAIGVGTMIGAGIFVFPGIAAGRAGPGAIASFAIGAGIALLVALPTSELATAMPHSGGGYYYVSRALGTPAGVIVGIGQWIGLMFASAFYLVGFGHYLNDLLAEAGSGYELSVEHLAIAAGVTLTLIALTGAERTGDLQNQLVSVLVVVFATFVIYGILDAVGVIGQRSLPEEFLPFGGRPVLTTAALVFTSYLGFAQIATVAGDIRDPGRNLPRAMVGGVLIVGLLYVLMVFVSTSAFDSAQLGEFGETASVEVARRLLGAGGALLLTGLGLIATLSSANASIMSASRAVYALSKDDLLPERAAVVNERFGTPHISLVLAGVPTVVLVALGRTETLAEVASFLHLVMYGLICVSLLVMRRSAPAWYAPVFRTPLYPALPVAGAISSFAIIAFMDGLSIALGSGVLALAGGWFLTYAREVQVAAGEREEVPALSPLVDAQVLLPVLLPEPDPMPAPLQELLTELDMVVLGVYEVRRQTAAEQAREQFGDEAEQALESWLAPMRERGGQVDSRLVFSQTPLDTIERVAAEQRTDAILVPRPLGEDRIDQVLVAVRSAVNASRIASFVAALAREADAEVSVVHVAAPGDDRALEEGVLETYEREFADNDLPSGRISSRIIESDDPRSAISEATGRNDIIVIGETDPDDADVVLGDLPRHLASRVQRPVLVVRRRGPGGTGQSGR